MFPRKTANHTDCPYCMMLRSAMRHAFIGMSISAAFLFLMSFLYQGLSWH